MEDFPIVQKEIDFYKKVIEAILFCAGRPVKVKELFSFFEKKLTIREIESILEELQREYEFRGVRILPVAGGFRVESSPEVSEYLKKFFQPRPFRWTKPLLETLAIIAYFQPITRAEISAKRGGVEVSPHIKTLLERGFIKVVGRKAVPGRPALYGTTNYFLEYFGLNSLQDLPPIEELEKLMQREG
ncbi:MAG: SMC-Scp complex subunit ScpB [Caldimicrobium sp.]